MAPGIIWRRHIDQLKPTAVEPDTVEVSQPEVVSLPPAPIQQSAPPDGIGTVPENSVADQPEMVSVPSPVATDPPEVTPVRPMVRSVSGGTPRECAGHHRDSISELFFFFFPLFSVFLRNCRLPDTVSRFSCFLENVS